MTKLFPIWLTEDPLSDTRPRELPTRKERLQKRGGPNGHWATSGLGSPVLTALSPWCSARPGSEHQTPEAPWP